MFLSTTEQHVGLGQSRELRKTLLSVSLGSRNEWKIQDLKTADSKQNRRVFDIGYRYHWSFGERAIGCYGGGGGGGRGEGEWIGSKF
jgi:hypothetical protein